jgi:type IV secretory pathway VirB4 component
VTRAIDLERRAHFEREQGHFESRHAIILTYRPTEQRRSSLSKYIYSDETSRTQSYADTVLFIFRNTIREIEQYLANTISIRRMATRETQERGGRRVARYDELMQFIRFCITGDNHPVRLPDIPDVPGLGRNSRAAAWRDADGREPVPWRCGHRRAAGRKLARHTQ